MINVTSFQTEDIHCRKCNGSCWDNDPKKRQENALKRFGKIPNPCVDDQDGKTHCPSINK